MRTYADFLSGKAQVGEAHGFEPLWLPESLFDWQQNLADWLIRRGRAACLADCGLGKTRLELTVGENVVRHTNRPYLLLTPLAVGHQTVSEAGKIGVECFRSMDGKFPAHPCVVVANYERLHLFDPADFAGVGGDESSGIKDFDGSRRAAVTEFFRGIQYRHLYTATAAPNDYIELGTHSEALGELGYRDMLTRFFKSDDAIRTALDRTKWRFKHHAERPFWQWVCSWARAVRKPSDLGPQFAAADARYVLPRLIEREHVVQTRSKRAGMLFDMPAMTLQEERAERRATLADRCELAARLVAHDRPAVCWCHLNDEADLIERLVPGAIQVSGADSDEAKEEKFVGFAAGKVRVLVTKPKIAALGLNWQHCAHQTTFASHSFQDYYQQRARSLRFGQTRDVTIDSIASEGERGVVENLQRKAALAVRMFDALVACMHEAMVVARAAEFPHETARPAWL